MLAMAACYLHTLKSWLGLEFPNGSEILQYIYCVKLWSDLASLQYPVPRPLCSLETAEATALGHLISLSNENLRVLGLALNSR